MEAQTIEMKDMKQEVPVLQSKGIPPVSLSTLFFSKSDRRERCVLWLGIISIDCVQS